MTSSQQPLQVRRRGGAPRGDHGSFVAAEPASGPDAAPPTDTAAPPNTADQAAPTKQAGPTDVAAASPPASPPASPADTARPVTRPRRGGRPVSSATAAAKAAYDAKPKIIWRGVPEDTYYALRAIYKHQLHTPDGVEGWSEWGRIVLDDFVAKYEAAHGTMSGGEDVELPAGRRMGQ